MENTPEYQEYRLNVEMKNSLIEKINSYSDSLKKLNLDLVDYKKVLVKACEANGHEYGKEILKKEWVERMVSAVESCVPGTYHLLDKDVGSYLHTMHSYCKFCGHEKTREAVAAYS